MFFRHSEKVRNLSKNLCVTFSFIVNFLVIASCNQEQQPKYEDFNKKDFVLVPGIVTKITRTPIYARGRSNKYNIYYAYNLESDTILLGKEMDVDLALKEGDGFYVLVHKKDKDINFISGPRLLPKDQRILESYLRKSKESGVKYFGVDEK